MDTRKAEDAYFRAEYARYEREQDEAAHKYDRIHEYAEDSMDELITCDNFSEALQGINDDAVRKIYTAILASQAEGYENNVSNIIACETIYNIVYEYIFDDIAIPQARRRYSKS